MIVNPETDFMEERFRSGQVVLIGPAAGAREYEIREVRFHQGRPLVGLRGVETMTDAEALAGLDVWIPESEVAPLPDGTFYRHDLVGCDVFGSDGARVGRVTAVEGSLDRGYLVVDEHVMIPLVGGIVMAIDVAGRRITIEPPEGLLDLNPPARR